MLNSMHQRKGIISDMIVRHHYLDHDSYHSVTLEAGVHLMTYYLSLLQVQQVHAK
jgi:hypothetical protein